MRTSLLYSFCLLLATGHACAGEAKNIYGLTEHVQIVDIPVALNAKLDTGAQTASLSAHNIQRFKRNGESWVRFELYEKGLEGNIYERPLARVSKIKRRAGDYQPDEGDQKTYTARPVIEVSMCMGNTLRTVEVNLTDRSSFEFPLLIGSDALIRFSALIDPSSNYAAGQPNCTANDAE